MYLLIIMASLTWMIILLFKSREQTCNPVMKRRVPNPYPGASIGPRKGGCPEVLAIEHRRFLAWEAPDIPISGCSAKACHCRYVCYPDRRAEAGDRRSRFNGLGLPNAYDRRETSDRRRVTLEEEMDFSDFSWELDPAVDGGEMSVYPAWRDPVEKRPPRNRQ